MAPPSIAYMSRDSMKLALKTVAIHDDMEELSLSLPEALKLDDDTRQKLQQLQLGSHPEPMYTFVYISGDLFPAYLAAIKGLFSA